MAIWSKIKVEDEDVEDFLRCFVAIHPPPKDENGKPISPLAWWRQWNKETNFDAYRRGKKMLTTVDVNEGIVKRE